MITLKDIETKHNYDFPPLFKTLWEDEMLNWMRGFTLPLEKGKTWAEDVYPTLKENPPLLLHSGGTDFELLTPDEMLHFKFPEDWDRETHHFIPFAKTAEDGTYAFYNHTEIEGENPIVLIWEDDEAEYVAKNFEDFIFRKMIEATDDIDKNDLFIDYGKDDAMEHYRIDLKSDLQSIQPYLKKEYVSVLEETYNADILQTLISYGFIGSKPVKNVIDEMLDFPLMGEFFDHEIL